MAKQAKTLALRTVPTEEVIMADVDSLNTFVRIHSRPPRDAASRSRGGFLLGNCKRHPPGALPEKFFLTVRDGGMNPLVKRGEEALFSTTAEPCAGNTVLVGTIFGPAIRQYAPRPDGQWSGVALARDYEDIHTVEEDCWIIGVLIEVIRAPEARHD